MKLLHSNLLKAGLLAAGFALAAGCSAGRYPLLNPLFGRYRTILVAPAKNSVQKVIEENVAAGRAEHVAVYYQSLSTGYWFGINEQQKFIPASLLKTYLAAAIMKEAEQHPDLLSRRIKYEDLEAAAAPGAAPAPEILSVPGLQPGTEYTVEELTERMLRFSDNNAAYNLNAHLTEPALRDTHLAFGLPAPGSSDNSITVKQYMMLLLSLYNSTYLSPEMSQRLLGYLSRGTFKHGLAAGLPPEVRLANKFGERMFMKDGRPTRQLHDCGIIYYKNFPYMLGVMTHGKNMADLESVIAEISRAVYLEVSSRAEDAEHGR